MTSLSFGKFKGQPLSTLTAQYINYCLAQEYVTPDVKAALQAEQQRRVATVNAPTSAYSIPAANDVLALALGKAVLTLLASNVELAKQILEGF